MVVGLDLKPLSEETIAQMGYNNHDLWLVKIGSITFGPYETESLKHYVHDNEHLFETAEAKKIDEEDFQSFWNHPQFQRRKIQAVTPTEIHQGPFWLLQMGLKVGPFTFKDIDKKIEMGLLGMTDHISVDDGHHWKKIFEIEGFDRRAHDPDSLPMAPLESDFQKAKLELVEKLERPHVHTSDELAGMAHTLQAQAKVIQFKIEEMTLERPRETYVAPQVKWAIPAAVAVVFAIVTTGYFMFKAPSEEVPNVAESTGEKPFYQARANNRPAAPRGFMPSVNERSPASVNYNRPAPSFDTPAYPTVMETHADHYEEPVQERDPLESPVTDAEQPVEHSLVGNTVMDGQDVSLDAAMNGIQVPVETPVVEEASDF